MAASYPKLKDAAFRLRKAAPVEFAELIRAFDEICHDLHVKLVGAESAAILQVQGRAQQADDLLAAFDPPQPKEPLTPRQPTNWRGP